MRNKIFYSLASAIVFSAEAVAAETSFTREPSNPLFRICSVENAESNDQSECKGRYIKSELDRCYGASNISSQLEKCIGKGRGICRVVSEFDSTISINFCAKSALKIWDEILEAEYSQFLKWAQSKDEGRDFQLDGGTLTTRLETSQTDWFKYRKSKCDFILGVYFEGTARGSFFFNCKIKMTAERAIYLKTQRKYL